ncbi:histidinol-phosphate transaminase [Flavobacterium sp.]|uniref:histidinol-phosphate transaminase n=1 Tax=Flavobacterium sp. TaxID=239 RepID=UPI0011FB1E7E|nr:histidinol-phosphate transaminase [Flavobacterium sp.]RZJ69512.1 MAG: histidinol-phosphate transaminase [Flavobacterium sp.]
MFDLTTLIRPNIAALQPYSSARDEFSGKAEIYLDANENPFGQWNRYPDPTQFSLKKKLSEVKKIPMENIFIGNGSDEIIDLLLRVFCEPKKDKILTFMPTYGMYSVCAALNDVTLLEVALDENFQIDEKRLNSILSDENLKAIFLCSPNNPTGNTLDRIDKILENFNGIVVVDEAYIDFSDSESLLAKLEKYPNLVILQTLSKAWGLAAARIGIGFASAEIVQVLDRVKPPYNVSQLNQDAAISALDDVATFENRLKTLIVQRFWLISELEKLQIVKKVYPTQANFVLAEFTDADLVYENLLADGIIVRNRNSVVKNCLRISVGTPTENQLLIAKLQQLKP